MSKLVKPIDYALLQGISRQAVYTKIKKGALNSKTIDGKIYIVVDDINIKEDKKQEEVEKTTSSLVDVQELLKSKEQTISILKESILDLKHTNTEMNIALRGEIELLKQVFSEMRNLYVKQVDYMVIDKQKELISHPSSNKAIGLINNDSNDCWVTLEEFFVRCKISKERQKIKIVNRLRGLFMKNDERIKIENDVFYLNCYHFYEDVLN